MGNYVGDEVFHMVVLGQQTPPSKETSLFSLGQEGSSVINPSIRGGPVLHQDGFTLTAQGPLTLVDLTFQSSSHGTSLGERDPLPWLSWLPSLPPVTMERAGGHPQMGCPALQLLNVCWVVDVHMRPQDLPAVCLFS